MDSAAELRDAPAGQLVPPEPTRFSTLSPSLLDTSANPSPMGTPSPEHLRPILTSADKNGDNEKAPLASHSQVRRRRRWLYLAVGSVVAVIIALAVALPVTLVHRSRSSTSTNSAHGGPSSNPESPTGAVTGGNGSVITTEDGVTFTYVNNFGGTCKSIYYTFYVAI